MRFNGSKKTSRLTLPVSKYYKATLANQAAQKVEELESKLDAMSEEEEQIAEEISDLSDRITDSKEGLAEAQKAADEHYLKMKDRIRYMYENSCSRLLNRVFASGSIGESLKVIEYASAVYEYDRKLMREYLEFQEAIAERKAELEDEYDEAEDMKARLQDKHDAMAVLLDAKNEEVEKLDGDLSDAQKIKQEYEQEVAAQNEVLAAIQAEIARQAAEEEARRKEEEARRQAEAEAKRRAEEEARQKAEAEAEAAGEESSEDDSVEDDSGDTEDYVADDEDDGWEEPSEEASASASGFIWPCPSSRTITSEYGTREAPMAGASSEHRGIDIGASSGSDIVAAQSGTVITSTYSNSGGNMVIISHGKNSDGQLVCSVYMHASALYVSVGDQVSQGQKIAAVGSTGYSTGPHLHFGVTVGGSYVNPHNYV